MEKTATKEAVRTRGLKWGAFWVGFALSGFFDGILLHQILQWHHLLSAIRGDDIRFQVLADGYFHLLMYLIAALGLWQLWRVRADLGRPGGSRTLLGYLLIGFGVWHVVDALMSHWLIGLHRIKLDSSTPLLWDIGWLAAFGAIPLFAGLALLRGAGRPSGPASSALIAVIAITIGAGYWASRPAPGQSFATIVFSPAVDRADALREVLSAGDALFWLDGSGVYVASGVSMADAFHLYQRGALLVTGSGAPSGCLAWMRSNPIGER